MSNGTFSTGSNNNDDITGNDDANVMDGGYGDDRLIGGAGDDQLDGGRGSDILHGGAGDDFLISRGDAGEQEIGQNDTAKLYEDQAFIADDVMVGGAGADTFAFMPGINAKEEFLRKHANGDGDINWMGVAGENNNEHDHWVDTIGTDVIADFNKAEGDQIAFYGHTAADVRVTYEDVDGDGDQESIVKVYSDQGNNGGAHDDDHLGTIIVHGDRVEQGDVQTNAGVHYGVIQNLADIDEALNPSGTRDDNPDDNTSANPNFDGNVDNLLADLSDMISQADAGNSQGISNSNDAGSPVAAFSLASFVDGVSENSSGNTDAGFYEFGRANNSDAVLQTGNIETTAGPNGGTATVFNGNSQFAFIPSDDAYNANEGTIAVSFRADNLEAGKTQTIAAQDEKGTGDGGHWSIRVADNGQLLVRVAPGDGGANKTYQTNANVITEGQWQDVAVNYSPNGVEVYVNGEKLPDSAFSQVEGAAVPLSEYGGFHTLNNDQGIIIGADTRISDASNSTGELSLNDDTSHHFEGAIADFGIWSDYSLSDAEINQLANNGLDEILTGEIVSEMPSDGENPSNTEPDDDDNTTPTPSTDETPGSSEGGYTVDFNDAASWENLGSTNLMAGNGYAYAQGLGSSGITTFDTVLLNGSSAEAVIKIRAEMDGNTFDGINASDSLRDHVKVLAYLDDSDEPTLIDEFYFVAAEQAFVSQTSGQEFGDDFAELEYSFEGYDSVQLVLDVRATGLSDERIEIDEVVIVDSSDVSVSDDIAPEDDDIVDYTMNDIAQDDEGSAYSSEGQSTSTYADNTMDHSCMMYDDAMA
ncbi:MAG: LamG-like jellyroll fold domain-containing protein [Pseudomonadota bacterium]